MMEGSETGEDWPFEEDDLQVAIGDNLWNNRSIFLTPLDEISFSLCC